MLITTKGIIFRVTKYRETSIIVNIYTEQLGLNSYIVNGVRAAKGKYKIGHFEPLNLVEIIAYHKPGREIERLTEIKSAHPLHNIKLDIYKSTMSMFLVEVLNKCLVEHDKNEALFYFLYNAILTLENTTKNNNFHLQFMLKLTSYLGFGIHDSKMFIGQSNNSLFYATEANNLVLQALIESDLSDVLKITRDQRQNILNDILIYYRLHLEMSKLKSLEVLQTIFK